MRRDREEEATLSLVIGLANFLALRVGIVLVIFGLFPALKNRLLSFVPNLVRLSRVVIGTGFIAVAISIIWLGKEGWEETVEHHIICFALTQDPEIVRDILSVLPTETRDPTEQVDSRPSTVKKRLCE